MLIVRPGLFYKVHILIQIKFLVRKSSVEVVVSVNSCNQISSWKSISDYFWILNDFIAILMKSIFSLDVQCKVKTSIRVKYFQQSPFISTFRSRFAPRAANIVDLSLQTITWYAKHPLFVKITSIKIKLLILYILNDHITSRQQELFLNE